MLKNGIYEQIVNTRINKELQQLDREKYDIELEKLDGEDARRILPDALGVRLNIGGYACNLGLRRYALFPMPDMAGPHITGSPLYICLHLCSH